MGDDDKLSLRPASAQETLFFALRYAGRKRVHHATMRWPVLPPSAWSSISSCPATC